MASKSTSLPTVALPYRAILWLFALLTAMFGRVAF